MKSFLYTKFENRKSRTRPEQRRRVENLVRLIIFLAACSLVAVAACNTAPAEPNTPAESAADSVAATVNGVDILESRIETQVNSQLQRMAGQVPPAFAEQYKKQLRQQTLEKMIIEQLLNEKIKAEKTVVTDEEVIDQLKEIASQQRPPLSLEDFKALIEAQGTSFDQVKQQIQKGLSYQKLLQAKFADRTNVTEDDVRKYYSENAKRIEQVRASHILIKPEAADPNTDPNEAKAKAKAENLLLQIKNGADFAELAKANSSCPSSAKGGDLDFFKRDRMVPAFAKAAFELKVGQVSDVVETKFGYHIIKVTDRKDDTFERAKDDLMATLKASKQREIAQEYIESLKAEAKIIYPPGKEPKADKPPPRPLRPPVEPMPKPPTK